MLRPAEARAVATQPPNQPAAPCTAGQPPASPAPPQPIAVWRGACACGRTRVARRAPRLRAVHAAVRIQVGQLVGFVALVGDDDAHGAVGGVPAVRQVDGDLRHVSRAGGSEPASSGTAVRFKGQQAGARLVGRLRAGGLDAGVGVQIPAGGAGEVGSEGQAWMSLGRALTLLRPAVDPGSSRVPSAPPCMQPCTSGIQKPQRQPAH